MKNKGFTLVELLGVIIILSLLAFLVSQLIINSIKSTNQELSTLAEDIVISAAREHVSENSSKYPKNINNVYCISYSELENDGKINADMLPDINEATLAREKQIQIIYTGTIYEYSLVSTCSSIIGGS